MAVITNVSSKSYDRDTIFLGSLGNPNGSFAIYSLAVYFTLTGHYNIGILDRLIQP